MAILDRCFEPPQRSTASVSARRTRTSSNGFFLWLGVTMQDAVPVAFLDRDVLAERRDEVVAALRRKAAELDRGLVAADRLHAQRLLVGEDRLEAVEIGLACVIEVLLRSPLTKAPASRATNMNGPEPITFFSYQRMSVSSFAFE